MSRGEERSNSSLTLAHSEQLLMRCEISVILTVFSLRWCYGKGLDKFAPIGPVLVSPKIFDSSDVKVASKLNGQDFQEDSTESMIHTVPRIIEHFSQGTTLEKGDVIMTGTPANVGYARNPPVFLQDGDEVRIVIDGIGTLRHTIKYE